ncbi:MAG: hypothetical protein ACR2HA_07960 [Nocardioides sp.]
MNYQHELDTFIKTLQSVDPWRLRASPDDMRSTLGDIVEAGAALWTAPMPVLVSALTETARLDLALARLVEGHADAMRILDQADEQAQRGVYGVWASRPVGTGATGQFRKGSWIVRGELRFAAGVDLIDRALVPVWVDRTHHQLLDLPLEEGSFEGDPASWRTAAMDATRSWTVLVDTVAPINATVGPLDWYLDRPGFVIGGLGVAAVWAGGTHLVLDLLIDAAQAVPFTAGQLRRLGAVDQAAWESRTAVDNVASRLDDLPRNMLAVEIGRARTAAAQACERVIAETAHIVGPDGLSRDERLVRSTHDLGIYVRQLAVDPELEARGRHVAHETRPHP